MKHLVKILTYCILPALIVCLAYLIYSSIMTPVNFDKEKAHREEVAVDRLKAIRTLQVFYKEENGRFLSTADSLINFYKNGEITVIKQIGSFDDSLAVAQKRVRRDSIRIAVKDTLLKNHKFHIDSIKYIPFSGQQEIFMGSVVRKVSGIDVPLFEAEMPYEYLLRGMDKQLIINLKAEREALEKFNGLKVGSIDHPNNNAGNWE